MIIGRLLVYACCMGLLATSPALADDPTPKPKDDQSKRICKVVTPTGSRFSKRVCMTEEDWKRNEEYAQTKIDENARSMRSPPVPGAASPQ